MSGHSKWSTIKHKKEKTDVERAKVFTKIGRKISVAVRNGGPNPANNEKLREAILKAKASNVPNSNIERIIKKASDGTNKENYEEIVYEGYGVLGVAFLVRTLTNNRNRTSANLRYYFDKFGGNLGAVGSVSYLFSRKGLIVVECGFKKEEEILSDCLDFEIEDVLIKENLAEIFVKPKDVEKIKNELEKKGFVVVSAEVEDFAKTFVKVEDFENFKKIENLINALEEDDDVMDISNNLKMDLDG